MTLNKAMQAESVKLYRCHKLHATITLAHCKSLRGRKSCNFDGVSKPPQCNDCEDWMSWGDGETVEFKQPKEVTVPTKEKMRCAGCGEIKILQSKDLCHKCNLARIKAEKTENKKAQNTTPEGTVPTTKLNAETVRLDFDADMDLLEALSAQAHRNYRSISNEILAALRSATGVERPRKNAA